MKFFQLALVVVILSLANVPAHAGQWVLDHYISTRVENDGFLYQNDSAPPNERYHEYFVDTWRYPEGGGTEDLNSSSVPNNTILDANAANSTFEACKASIRTSVTPVFKWVGGGEPAHKFWVREKGHLSIYRKHGRPTPYTWDNPYEGEHLKISADNGFGDELSSWGHTNVYFAGSANPAALQNGTDRWHIVEYNSGGASEKRGKTRVLSASVSVIPYTAGQPGESFDVRINSWYQAEVCNVSLTATPLGPYDLLRNQPTDKSYRGLSRWTNEIENDGVLYDQAVPNGTGPDTILKALHVAPVISAESSFVATAKTANGADLFTDQQYTWQADPETSRPVQGVFSVDNQPDMLMYKWFQDGVAHYTNVGVNLLGQTAVDSQTFGLGGEYLPDLHLDHQMVPQFRDELLRTLEMGWRAAFPDPTTKIETSTPTKNLTWKLGTDYNNFSAKSKVKVQITGSAPGDPVLKAKVRIDWKRPKKNVFRVTIYPTVWHVPQGTGVVDSFRSAFASDESLQSQIELWAGLQIANVALLATGPIAEAVEPIVMEITTVGDASASVITDQALASAVERAEAAAATDEALVGAEGTARVKVEPVAEEGEAAEPAVEREATVTGSNCFVAGTPVLMADGTLKSIEQVQVGDLVESKDPQTGQQSAKRVSRTFRNLAPIVLALTLGNGEVINTTPGHPFATSSNGTSCWRAIC